MTRLLWRQTHVGGEKQRICITVSKAAQLKRAFRGKQFDRIHKEVFSRDARSLLIPRR